MMKTKITKLIFFFKVFFLLRESLQKWEKIPPTKIITNQFLLFLHFSMIPFQPCKFSMQTDANIVNSAGDNSRCLFVWRKTTHHEQLHHIMLQHLITCYQFWILVCANRFPVDSSHPFASGWLQSMATVHNINKWIC